MEVRKAVASVTVEQRDAKFAVAELNANLKQISETIEKSSVFPPAPDSEEAQGAAAIIAPDSFKFKFATIDKMSNFENAKLKGNPRFNLFLVSLSSKNF